MAISPLWLTISLSDNGYLMGWVPCEKFDQLTRLVPQESQIAGCHYVPGQSAHSPAKFDVCLGSRPDYTTNRHCNFPSNQ